MHALTSSPLAFAVCATWGAGVPCLAFGLATGDLLLIRLGALLLLTGVLTGACQIVLIVSCAMR